MITDSDKPTSEERLSPDTHEFGVTTTATKAVSPPDDRTGWFLVDHDATHASTKARPTSVILWARRRNWDEK